VDKAQIYKAYLRRNRILHTLRFADYAEYLASELWRSIRQRVLTRDKGLCTGCKGPANEVHHGSYTRANLTGLDLRDLYSVCRVCHHACEFKANGEKRPAHKTVKALKNILRPARKRKSKRRNKAARLATRQAQRDAISQPPTLPKALVRPKAWQAHVETILAQANWRVLTSRQSTRTHLVNPELEPVGLDRPPYPNA
jgi:5-methylcytosine-specific restriction endonuclease McrA